MPIQSLAAKQKLPVLGKIRLGVRKEAKSGSLYPTTVEFFVLDDAPGVAEVYGADPKALDIVFPADDLDRVLPTWFKWYSAGRTSNGKALGGKLNCYGNGPDDNGNPGVAHFLAGRDPVTRTIPTRPCLGQQCPDWRDSRGNQQCKQAMQVYVLLPRVTWFGVFQIDTTSWRSISSFHNQLALVKELNGGVIRGIPFKVVRQEEVTTFHDPKTGKEQTGRQFIMKLVPNEGFQELHGSEVKKKFEVFRNTTFTLSEPAQTLLEAPMEDHFPALAPGQTELDIEAEALPPEAKVAKAEDLLKDPEIMAAFDELGRTQGKEFSEKNRLIAIRKKEAEPDVKGAVLKTIKDLLAKAHAAEAKAQPVAKAAPVTVEVLDDGIM